MKTARILSGLLGFVLLILGVQWIIDPQAAQRTGFIIF